jgi:hypothetical protein
MEKARSDPLGRDLAHAHRTGPFSAALHLAIEDRGIRPEEIQERLSAAGVSVSLATLSYWRRRYWPHPGRILSGLGVTPVPTPGIRLGRCAASGSGGREPVYGDVRS